MNADDIKKTVDLAEYIRSRGVALRKRGKDLVGLCPFHKDSKPSLVVTPSKRLWHCLGCGKGGSVIDFVMHADSLDFKAALRMLRGAPPPAPPGKGPLALCNPGVLSSRPTGGAEPAAKPAR